MERNERDELAQALYVAYLSADHMCDGVDAAARAYRLADNFLAERSRQNPTRTVEKSPAFDYAETPLSKPLHTHATVNESFPAKAADDYTAAKQAGWKDVPKSEDKTVVVEKPLHTPTRNK